MKRLRCRRLAGWTLNMDGIWQHRATDWAEGKQHHSGWLKSASLKLGRTFTVFSSASAN